MALLGTIRRSRNRMVAGALMGTLAEALVIGLLLFLAFGTIAQSAGWGRSAWIGFWIFLALALSAYLLWRVAHAASLKRTAILLDRILGFRDRVSSALVFLQRQNRTAFMEAHLQETADFLQHHGQEAIALPWPQQGRALAVFLTLCLAALLPHNDRAVLERLDRESVVQTKAQAAQALLLEMDHLKQHADLRGLKKLTQMVAEAEREMKSSMKLLTPEDLAPPPQPQAKTSTLGGQNAKDEAEKNALELEKLAGLAGTTQEGLRLAKVPTYQPVGKFDSFPEATYTGVFGELDGSVLNGQLNAKELENLAEHIDNVAEKIDSFGYYSDGLNNAAEGQARAQRASGKMPEGQMEKALAPLEYKAFSEFLKRYASHVSNKAMGQAKLELSKQGNKSGDLMNISDAPPKDAKFALKGVTDQRPNLPILQGNADQASAVASQSGSQKAPNGGKPGGSKGLGTELGGSGAGVGASERSGQAPPVLPQAEGGTYLPLKGKLGDGESMIQLIHDRGKRNLATPSSGAVSYREVFVEYAQGAEAELNSENVPADMRDYIRDYFRSIRPDAEAESSTSSP